jgi:hypothetical protein
LLNRFFIKHSSFCPGACAIKLFYSCNLRIFVMSQSVYPWQASPGQSLPE